MKKICVVTGTRAEYGLLRWVMQGIKNSNLLQLQIVATGMHLSPEFGLTFKSIEDDGFIIDRKVEMLLSSDTPVGIAKSIGLGTIGFADALAELNPDLLLLLGDRFEILSAAIAATTARLPIAHLHGGETTEGLIDEAFRHSITKMSHLHFVAAKTYQNRIIQMGENPKNVYMTGGLGIDNILKLELLSLLELETSLGFRFGKRNLLVTFHPVTLDVDSAKQQIGALLSALELLENTRFIFTLPNADTEGRVIIAMIQEFISKHPDSAAAFMSLGQVRYLSCMKYVDGIVGNSSSGLIEAPSFKKGTVNIGDRQHGRLKAASVIDCKAEKSEIEKALQKLYSDEFQKSLTDVENPYGTGGASKKIVQILEQVSFKGLLKKKFYNVESN